MVTTYEQLKEEMEKSTTRDALMALRYCQLKGIDYKRELIEIYRAINLVPDFSQEAPAELKAHAEMLAKITTEHYHKLADELEAELQEGK